MMRVEHPDRVRGDAEHRADREVDVSRDDDDGFADREQGDDRGAREQLLDARGAEEEVVVDRGRTDDDHQREDDAELPEAEQKLRDVVRAHARPGDLLLFCERRHTAASSTMPVAARMIASSSASARANSRITRPSKSTTMRSAIPSTSGSSDEIISPATPWAPSSESRRGPPAFVPTPLPRAGPPPTPTRG